MTAPTSPSRERLATDYAWTPRQREVLALIAAGKTNGEIGEALGISLDGAKWHVSEILSKLNAHSREEAADYWRAHQRPRARLARALRSIGPGAAAFKWVAGSLAVGAVTIVGVAAFAALGGDDTHPATTPTSQPTAGVLVDSTLAPCAAPTEVTLGFQGPGSDGIVHVFVRVPQAAATCTLRTGLAVSLNDATSSTLIPNVTGNGTLHTLDVAVPASGTVAHLQWTNYCNTTSRPILVAQLGNANPARNVDGLPPCKDANGPSVLELAAEWAWSGVPCPVTRLACDAAENATRLLQAGDYDGLLTNVQWSPYVCTSRQYGPLCDGAAEGEIRHGYPITLHGSEGEAGTLDRFRAWLMGTPGGTSATSTLAAPLVSIGCAATGCEQFIVVFHVGQLPEVLYLAYDARRLPDTANSARLVGLGRSGDNADDILAGRPTITEIGQTTFFRYSH